MVSVSQSFPLRFPGDGHTRDRDGRRTQVGVGSGGRRGRLDGGVVATHERRQKVLLAVAAPPCASTAGSLAPGLSGPGEDGRPGANLERKPAPLLSWRRAAGHPIQASSGEDRDH
uniref:Predicted protein n=1 Tax=Hordeum vulgare subsp. vulgare TaxID=112509 RepID=F2D414_HORVV|nr:predicted protein [Hordeum vulgare subsp. vulgare]